MAGWSIGPYGEGDFGEGEPNAVINAVGVEAVGAIGTSFIRQSVEIAVTGVQASGELGELPSQLGWGIGPWGEGQWGVGNPNVDVILTGVAGAGELGETEVGTGANIFLVGVQGDVELGETEQESA